MSTADLRLVSLLILLVAVAAIFTNCKDAPVAPDVVGIRPAPGGVPGKPPDGAFSQISASEHHSCALTTEGKDCQSTWGGPSKRLDATPRETRPSKKRLAARFEVTSWEAA